VPISTRPLRFCLSQRPCASCRPCCCICHRPRFAMFGKSSVLCISLHDTCGFAMIALKKGYSRQETRGNHAVLLRKSVAIYFMSAIPTILGSSSQAMLSSFHISSDSAVWICNIFSASFPAASEDQGWGTVLCANGPVSHTWP
jgi:hypothetical protein